MARAGRSRGERWRGGPLVALLCCLAVHPSTGVATGPTVNPPKTIHHSTPPYPTPLASNEGPGEVTLGQLVDEVRGHNHSEVEVLRRTKHEATHPDGPTPPTTYLIVASRLARPSSVYRVAVTLTAGKGAVDVRARLYSPHAHLQPAHASITPGHTKDLLIKVPDSAPPGEYTLDVEGRGHFHNSTKIVMQKEFLTILIHLSRPCFTGGQDVGVRAVLLTTELKPYQEPVDTFILDPQGNIVKRWISRTANVGVVSVAFPLPELPAEGWWRVRVAARGQIEEKKFLVHKVYEPLYETFVEMPFYALADGDAIEGTFTGSFSNDMPIRGNATITLYAKNHWDLPDEEFKKVDSLVYDYIEVEEDFSFPMSSLTPFVDQLEGAEVKVESEFHDAFNRIRSHAHSRLRIIGNRVRVEVVGSSPFVFRPGMPLHAVVSVRYADGEPLSHDRLASSTLVVTPKATTSTGATLTLPKVVVPAETTSLHEREELLGELRTELWEGGGAQVIGGEEWGNEWVEEKAEQLLQEYAGDQRFDEYRDKGIFRVVIDIPEDVASLDLAVTYADPDYQGATTAHAKAHYSPANRYLQVTSSTEEARLGEFAIFHVRNNFQARQFTYLIISKGVVLYSATEVTASDDVVTVSVAVGRGMAPRFTFFAYATDTRGEVVAHSLSLPVAVLADMQIELGTNQHKDHSKKTVEVVVGAPPGSFYALTCQRSLNFYKQHPNALTHARILHQMTMMEPAKRSSHAVLHRSREGEFADRLVALPAHNYGGDVVAAFQDAALVILTDAPIHAMPGLQSACNLTLGQLECGDGTCFTHHQLCDGEQQCDNNADELGCESVYQDFPADHDEQEDPLTLSSDTLFRMFRHNMIMDSFDTDDVDWCNEEVWVGHTGQEHLNREVAKTAEEWVMEGYALHPDYGFVLTPSPIFFNGDPPFYIASQGPAVCRRGEQISIRVIVHNMQDAMIQALVMVHDSEDYRFVHVERGGDVQHYSPRTSRGQHQHLLQIPGGTSAEVVIPLAVVKQQGTMSVTVQAVSQVSRDEETLEIEVKPEGVPVRKHTSIMLDLRNRALVYEFLDVAVDESPIIPFSIFRRFVYGSPAGRVSISGDVFGPIHEDIWLDHSGVFGGRHLRSTDGVAFNFGATLWTLHYLRLTNQLDTVGSRDAFEYLTVQLAGLLWRVQDGGFSMWADHPPSVWLTARVLHLLAAAQFEDWENFLYIDPQILTRGTAFLLRHQQEDGGFVEALDNTLDAKARGHHNESSVALTALVTVALHEVLPTLQGRPRTHATQARAHAVEFLEEQLGQLEDSYEVAVTTYALSLTASPSAETAVALLNKIKRTEGNMAYWSREPIKAHTWRQETSQRAFLLPREPEAWDAHAVEATSYGLLVLLAREGVTTNSEEVMRWLNAVRDWDQAFISTADTVVAMQALAEYSWRGRIRDVTDMECTLDVTSSHEDPHYFSVSNISSASYHSYELDNVWGHVNLIAKGSGQAVAQLEVSWGVDVLKYIEQPHKKYFDLHVEEHYHTFRNKSVITTTVCAKWLATEDSPHSHAALVEVELPTGYVFFQPLADVTVRGVREGGSFPQLRNAHTTDTHVFWQFEKIPGDVRQCFSYDVQRWYPAANHTAVRSAQVMELFSPEHFEVVMVNATPLAALDICEVCGSYQCPYCPAYSHAPAMLLPATLIALAFIPSLHTITRIVLL